MANIILRPKDSLKLPDNKQWTNRFEIRSQKSSRIYIVSQHISGRYWACSCPGWISRRYCKHLIALGLPCQMKPFEAQLQ